MRNGQNWRSISKITVLKSVQSIIASDEDSMEQIRLPQSTVSGQNAANSASSTVECNTVSEHGIKTNRKLLQTEKNIDTDTELLCSILVQYRLARSRKEAHTLFKVEALLEAKSFKVKAFIGVMDVHWLL